MTNDPQRQLPLLSNWWTVIVAGNIAAFVGLCLMVISPKDFSHFDTVLLIYLFVEVALDLHAAATSIRSTRHWYLFLVKPLFCLLAAAAVIAHEGDREAFCLIISLWLLLSILWNGTYILKLAKLGKKHSFERILAMALEAVLVGIHMWGHTLGNELVWVYGLALFLEGVSRMSYGVNFGLLFKESQPESDK